MVTTDKKKAGEYAHKMIRYSFIYLAAAVFCALFGAVYEIFSHGVFSFYMIYAFAFPLVLGAVPMLWMGLRTAKSAEEIETPTGFETDTAEDMWFEPYTAKGSAGTGLHRVSLEEESSDSVEDSVEYRLNSPENSPETERLFHLPGSLELNAWGSGIAALTVGSIFRGVLDIYGTTNRLVIVYPVVGGTLLAAGLIPFSIRQAVAARADRRKTVSSNQNQKAVCSVPTADSHPHPSQ